MFDFRIHRIIHVFHVSAAGMHFCERSREDPGNLETVRELYGCKDVGAIAIGGTDSRKVASMQTFRTPQNSQNEKQFDPRIASIASEQVKGEISSIPKDN
jgi:hypothetical protein